METSSRVKKQSENQEYRSMKDNEAVAASSKDTAVPKTVLLVEDEANNTI